MAPSKRKADDNRQPAEVEAEPAQPPARVTRAAAKRAAVGSRPPSVAEVPKEKTTTEKKGKGQKKKEEREKEEAQKEGEGVEADESDKGEAKAEGKSLENVLDGSNKTIVVEHCKQCNSFKTRANLVKEGLEKRTSGITVILNPEKPRRGCFEIREEGGKKFISLLDMKRPFKPMKDLDMDKVISDIINEISSTG